MNFLPHFGLLRRLRDDFVLTSPARDEARGPAVNKLKIQSALRYCAAGARWRLRVLAARAREQAQEWSFPWKVHWVSGPRSVEASVEEFVVVSLVRDGAVYLPEFLRHYRELGAKHIVLLDNGSTDGTPALVASEPDVTVMRTPAPFKIYENIMRRWLVTRFGRRNWVLCVDIDEFFDYRFAGR